jgi:hypothetical protein
MHCSNRHLCSITWSAQPSNIDGISRPSSMNIIAKMLSKINFSEPALSTKCTLVATGVLLLAIRLALLNFRTRQLS